MKVLIDTSVWSWVLRRKNRPENAATAAELASLADDGLIVMIGAIRQEILSGIKERAYFEWLRDYLGAFPDMELTSHDYEEAASLYNKCRENGIQGSNTDFLICAVAIKNDYSIFTTDEDFTHFAKILPIVLHQP
jgi:predicted nucleic acid-binding protein